MKKVTFTKNKSIIFVAVVVFLVVALVAVRTRIKNINQITDNKSRSDIILNEPEPVLVAPSVGSMETPAPTGTIDSSQKINTPMTGDPLSNARMRITKKPFGIFITTKNSPVQPERFSGFHTAVDLETFSDEQNADVAVKALCDGKLLSARSASGYGGVVVQSCNLDGQAVTIVYGHIKLSSITFKIGDPLKTGEALADLGDGFSPETDGERKHLHLGIHKGNAINILGYVQNKNQLNGWIDPAKYLN